MRPRPVPLGPVTAFAALVETDARLLTLLDDLTADEWQRPTIVAGWQVRHVAAHLLDTALRRLSVVRDGVTVGGPASASADDVRAYVDRVNAEGVLVLGRLSPRVMRTLMAPATADLHAWFASRPADAPAAFPVSWAGETASAHWFDLARELTERWHHQQQIRLALGRPGLMTDTLYHPVLDTFLRALPWTYRQVHAAPGTSVDIRVTGEAGGLWHLVRDDAVWLLASAPLAPPSATVTLDGDLAWRLFTKGVARDDARRASTIGGDEALAEPVFTTAAIVG